MSEQSFADDDSRRPLHPVTIDICTACRHSEDPAGDGRVLLERVEALCADEDGITVRPIECMAVCDRQVTVALRGPGLWSYVLGDVNAEHDGAELVAAARAVAAAPHGVPKLRDRPPVFRKGVICRLLPPPDHDENKTQDSSAADQVPAPDQLS
ncbi:DUF1636 domain-containing protein [Nisaea sp.]|uniref:DUF1636 domain-containing protein n=1 Tax=Nisaea sp. TaxID=2024842 RepID=UPI002B264D31|nr:DUF1636 domain-containing protein [Nisaea sp.]